MMITLIVGVLTFVAAADLVWGGIELIVAGGSSYYLAAGIALAVCALGIARRRQWSLPLYGALLLATWGWALWESGPVGWALVPRLVAPAAWGLLLLVTTRRIGAVSPWWIAGPVLLIVLTVGIAGLTMAPEERAKASANADLPSLPQQDPAAGQWRV